MAAMYEHKGTIPGLEYGPMVKILEVDGKKTIATDGMETKASADYGALLEEARARVAGDGDHDGDDEEEEYVIPEAPLPVAGPDEQVVLEAPLQTLTEDTRKQVLAAQLVAEEHLPPPGPPRELKVRFHVPYLRSTAEAYAAITERPVGPFTVGKGWGGHYDRRRPDELWVDVGPYAHELPRHVLHELCHAWRCRTPQAATMTADAMEDEAWHFADTWAPAVYALLSTPQEDW